jgi:hypothetical protein
MTSSLHNGCGRTTPENEARKGTGTWAVLLFFFFSSLSFSQHSLFVLTIGGEDAERHKKRHARRNHRCDVFHKQEIGKEREKEKRSEDAFLPKWRRRGKRGEMGKGDKRAVLGLCALSA